MQVATWNVNSIRTRLGHVIPWLQTHPVDVLCLQETKVVDADFPRQAFEDIGYHCQISGQKAYNGVALITRQPVTAQMGFSAVLGDAAADFDQQKRVIAAVVEGTCVVNLYVPNGSSLGSEKYDYKLRWLQLLEQYLQALQQDYAAINVCGDFNIAPEDRDIHDPSGKEKHIMSSPAERTALQKIVDLGFADAFRKFHPEGGHFSWWDYRAASFRRNLGWRIDHHYLTSILYGRVRSCHIDVEPRKLEKPSDHAPVVVEY